MIRISWHTFFYLVLATALMSCSASGQDKKQLHEETIARINSLILENYVFPDVAQQTADHLEKLLKKGEFNSIHTPDELARVLTREVQKINHDKHMRITPRQSHSARGEQRNFSMPGKFGFVNYELKQGNIGYIDLRGFDRPENAAPVADSIMAALSSAEYMIIDLRKNGGGSPEMVQYLCSYFFDEHIHLNSLYWRQGNRTEEFWTLDHVNGTKRPDVPLYLLTSHNTFSGAEEFSYNMKTRNRATLIGENTGGGANPGGIFTVDDELQIFIPLGRAINPVTNTNWEGTGVEPDIAVPSEDALAKALEIIRDR